MKFILSALGKFDYRYDEVVELEKLGFTFKKSNDKMKNGEFWWTKISDPVQPLELNSLEELEEFTNKYGNCVIGDGWLVIDNPDRQ